LDADLQRLAQRSLNGQSGAVVLLEIETGTVQAMASAPSFDPARLEEVWEALREDPGGPLVNRATQGLYQPGAALQSVVVAEALSQGLIDNLQGGVGPDVTRAVSVDGVTVGCSVAPEEPYTLGTAFAAACPALVGSLGEQLGAEGLAAAFERWRLTTPPELEIATEAPDWHREGVASPWSEAIGQGELTLSPLQVALVAATLGNDGEMPTPRLSLPDGPAAGNAVPILTPSAAALILGAWDLHVDDGTAGGGARGQWGAAVAGEGEPHAWFLGVSPAEDRPSQAIAVLIEHAADPRAAVRAGLALLEAAALR
jgi:peptidoglycan glycosyltransferase